MEDIKSWSIKILLPSLVAISIKLAVLSRSKHITWFIAITSYVTGVGSAYLATDMVISEVSPEYMTLVIAVIAISGEKIGEWFVYKFNVDSILQAFIERLKSK